MLFTVLKVINTQGNLKVINTQGNLKVINTQGNLKVINTQGNLKVINTQGQGNKYHIYDETFEEENFCSFRNFTQPRMFYTEHLLDC